MTTARFALLEHTTAEGVHWDFLLDLGAEKLATWRLTENPCAARGPIAAQRIADHRRDYLDYEGEISGGRGVVRRIDRGAARIELAAADDVIVELAGDVLRGRFAIVGGAASCQSRGRGRL
ncbi:MAG: hypothetical protein CHACPFDD_01146 [Phycisphaerae bacterium]|nr:hypothetical protein [Phycisphaerae bacterium]